jgi:hypothetical protein
MAGGRPTTYNKEVIEKAYDYIENCPDIIHSVVGLCIHIGRAKGLVYEWIKQSDKTQLNDIVCMVNELQEKKLVNGSLTNELNASISKMMLSKHGHIEIKEIDNKSSDGSMSNVTKIELVAPNHDNEKT